MLDNIYYYYYIQNKSDYVFKICQAYFKKMMRYTLYVQTVKRIHLTNIKL